MRTRSTLGSHSASDHDADAGPAPGRATLTSRHRALAAADMSSGAPLGDSERDRFGSSLGADLSGVRVHTGSASAEAAAAIGARAFAVGQDIHFGAGEYRPSSPDGQFLIAHEVAHTVQAPGKGDGARAKSIDIGGEHDASEAEADRAAGAMVSGQPASVSTASSGVVRRFLGPTTPPPATHAAPAPEVVEDGTVPELLDQCQLAIRDQRTSRERGVADAHAMIAKKDEPTWEAALARGIFHATLGVVAEGIGEHLAGLFVGEKSPVGKLLGKLFSDGIETSADMGIEAATGDEDAGSLERFMKGQTNALDDNIHQAESRFIKGRYHELAGLTAAEASALHARLELTSAAAEALQHHATVQAWLRFLAASHAEPASNKELALGKGQGVLHVWLDVFGPQYFKIKGALLNGVNKHVLAEIAHQPLGSLILDKVFDCGDFQIHQSADGTVRISGEASWLDARAAQAGKTSQREGAQLVLADLAKHECGEVAGIERELF